VTAVLQYTTTSDAEKSQSQSSEHVDSNDVDTDSGHSSPDSTTLTLASLDIPDSIPEHDEQHHGFTEPQLPQPAATISCPSLACRIPDRSHASDLLVSNLAVANSDQASFVTEVLNRLPKVTNYSANLLVCLQCILMSTCRPVHDE